MSQFARAYPDDWEERLEVFWEFDYEQREQMRREDEDARALEESDRMAERE